MTQPGIAASPAPGACPVCGTALGGAQACPNCGYNAVSIAAGGPSSVTSSSASGRSMRFAVLSSIFILLVGGAGYYVARYQRDVIRSVGAPIGLNHAIGTDYTPKKCTQRMTHYLTGLFGATEEPGGAAEVASLQTEAGEEFGVGTKEWRGLLDIYTSHAGIASINGRRKALKQSAPEIAVLCGSED